MCDLHWHSLLPSAPWILQVLRPLLLGPLPLYLLYLSQDCLTQTQAIPHFDFQKDFLDFSVLAGFETSGSLPSCTYYFLVAYCLLGSWLDLVPRRFLNVDVSDFVLSRQGICHKGGHDTGGGL